MKTKLTLFFIICIILRILIAYFTLYSLNNETLRLITSLILLCISVGFLYQYLTKYRINGAFGQKIWWDYMRPFHVMMYMYASYLTFNNNKYVFFVLLLDVFIGTLSFINNHYMY